MSSSPLLTQDATRHSATINIEQHLRSYFAQKLDCVAEYGDALSELWQVASSRVLGGKLVRPRLFLDMYRALGQSSCDDSERADADADAEAENVVSVAIAMELLHYSFLLHDDVIDGDLKRRGEANLIGVIAHDVTSRPNHAVTSPRIGRRIHWAQSSGILLGDLLLSDVHQIFARLDVSSVTRVRLLDALAHTIMDSVAGELTDVGLSDRIIAPSIAVVQDMCGRKTATYTFEFPLRAAAALQGSSAATENVLTKVGQRLGLAFQLRDDYLSTFGDPELHGKDAFSDLREGKETAAIAYARTTPQWSLMQELFEDRDLREARAHEIHALLVDAGADRFVAELINEQMAEFEALLDEHHELVPAEARQTLRDLVQELEGRNA